MVFYIYWNIQNNLKHRVLFYAFKDLYCLISDLIFFAKLYDFICELT